MDKNEDFTEAKTDYLLPMATKLFDMRKKGQYSCVWDEEFVINELASNLLTNKVLILFEILEVNTHLIEEGKTHLLNSELLYRVAWGYLRPLGTAGINTGKSRIQLYRYKYNSKTENRLQGMIDPRTPEVFLEF
jgi:hypothetical protein